MREDFQHQVSAVAEQFTSLNAEVDRNTETIGRVLEEMSEMKWGIAVLKEDVAVLKDDVSTLKTDVKEIKADLAKKADRSEVVALDHRVTRLEGFVPA